MLTFLRIHNLALAEDLTIHFEEGLNVITGETGAGKSMLIGALNLLLGERADKSIIRTGEESCSAECQFYLPDSEAVKALLKENDLKEMEDDSLIIRRVVKASSAGNNLINDQPVTLNLLKKLGDLLVDMHGPYDHQSLLKQDSQRKLLDAFGQSEKELAQYRDHFQQWNELSHKRNTILEDESDSSAQIDLLSYRINEIEDAALHAGEEEKILEEHALLANAQDILASGSQLLNAIDTGETSALELLQHSLSAASKLTQYVPEASTWQEELNQLVNQLNELGQDIHQKLDHMEANPERLMELDDRLSLYDKLKKKYGADVEQILNTLESAQEKLHSLQNKDEELERLNKEIARTEKELMTIGKNLSAKREKAAAKLSKEITSQLKPLGFPHGECNISLRESEPSASGLDLIHFGFAPNQGEEMRALEDIASSGEIARVMLSIKAVLAKQDTVPVLIFDEIDANVGGEMGHAIGEKMKLVSKHHQVISITHLPQVAVHGDVHHLVYKETRQGRTFSDVKQLAQDPRVEEIARMLGVTEKHRESGLQHAKEMLAEAR